MARAITERAKAEKANLILEKAYELYESGSFKSIKMIDIAKASSVSKGTLFNYFSTKEMLFLEILRRQQENRFESIIEELKQYDTLSHEAFKKIILDEMDSILIEDSPLIRLTAILHIILEENLDYETAYNFKKRLYDVAMGIGALIAERVDYLTVDDCMELFLAQHAIIVGYRNMANVPEVIKQVIDEHAMEALKTDFKGSALNAMELYMEGLHMKKSNDSERA